MCHFPLSIYQAVKVLTLIHLVNCCFVNPASTVYSCRFFTTGWVNRFANAGDIAMEVAGNTALRVRLFIYLFSI